MNIWNLFLTVTLLKCAHANFIKGDRLIACMVALMSISNTVCNTQPYSITIAIAILYWIITLGNYIRNIRNKN